MHEQCIVYLVSEGVSNSFVWGDNKLTGREGATATPVKLSALVGLLDQRNAIRQRTDADLCPVPLFPQHFNERVERLGRIRVGPQAVQGYSLLNFDGVRPLCT